MKKLRNIILSLIILIFTAILVCNGIICLKSFGKCYNKVDSVPPSVFGVLLGTGCSSDSSPYYDARIQAAVDLWDAGKIKMLIISGENLYEDYNEVDSMAADIKERTLYQLPIALDYKGTDTYSSLINIAHRFGFDNSYIIISQHFHNQRAVFLADKILSSHTIAYDAPDTRNIYWRTRNITREWLARIKAVFDLCIRKAKTTQPESIMDLMHNSVYAETHAYSLWHNRYWEVCGEKGKFPFEALLAKDAESIRDSLFIEISAECGGEPAYAHTDLPFERDEENNDVIISDTAYLYFTAFYTWYLDDFRIDMYYRRIDNAIGIYIEPLNNDVDDNEHIFDFDNDAREFLQGVKNQRQNCG